MGKCGNKFIVKLQKFTGKVIYLFIYYFIKILPYVSLWGFSVQQFLNCNFYSVQKRLSSSLLFKNVKIKIYRPIILLLVLFGCETWSLTLREESRLKVYQNRVLRRIFGPKGDGVTWEWRKLHNE